MKKFLAISTLDGYRLCQDCSELDSKEVSFHLSSLLDPDKMEELANLNTNERKLDQQPESKTKGNVGKEGRQEVN